MNKESPPKVFVTQELPISYRKAERFGEVVFLTSREATQSSNSLRNVDLLREVCSNLKGYRPGVDFIAPSGAPLTIGLAFMVASRKGSKLRILHWNNREEDYVEYLVNLDVLQKLGL